MTVQTLKKMRQDDSFNLFWDKVVQTAHLIGANDPQLPRRLKRPKRFDDGLSDGHHHNHPKAFYRQIYYEAVDLMINCIEDRFNQPGYRIYQQLEAILLKSCKSEDIENDLQEVCKFYQDDFDVRVLQTQLETFSVHYQQENPMDATTHITIFDIKKYMLSLSPAQLSLMSAIKRLLQLILVMPATNASSERSFSALRRVKSYLRATMKQERLN